MFKTLIDAHRLESALCLKELGTTKNFVRKRWNAIGQTLTRSNRLVTVHPEPIEIPLT